MIQRNSAEKSSKLWELLQQFLTDVVKAASLAQNQSEALFKEFNRAEQAVARLFKEAESSHFTALNHAGAKRNNLVRTLVSRQNKFIHYIFFLS